MSILTPLPPLHPEHADSDDEYETQDDKRHTLRANLGGRSVSVAALLERKVNFVAAKHSFALEAIPYRAINEPAVAVAAPLVSSPAPRAPLAASSVATTTPPTSISAVVSSRPAAFFPAINPAVGWQRNARAGRGLNNLGNTCFLNSAVQVLLHTAPLARYLEGSDHSSVDCAMRKSKGFCMTCAMKMVNAASFKPDGGSYSPTVISNNLKKIAQTMRHGRQEDAHEFLRFCIDGMQLSSVFGRPAKLDIRIKESTFVHQIFGGRLRSRVTCSACNHSSDTFDSMLDLSLDVQRVSSIKEALAEFVKVDTLKGANKYKCEKCKKLVVAEKNFTINVAPMVLTIHLKRFTSTGKKIGDVIKYPEVLQLGPYMSDQHLNPSYRLFGVINHSGGGPHSGHYTAYAKSASGKWHHFDDSSVSSSNSTPLNAKSAYVLFYCRDKDDALSAAIQGHARPVAAASNSGAGKRGRESDVSSYAGSPQAKKVYAGPQMPAHLGARPPTLITASATPPNHNGRAQAFASPQQQHQRANLSNGKVPRSPYGQPGSSSFSKSDGNNRGGGGGGARGRGKISITRVGSMRPRVLS